MVQPQSEDGELIIANFMKPIEQKEEQQNRETLDSTDAKPEGRTDTSSGARTIRVIIHGHHPTEATSNDRLGKLVYLPDSLEDLFCLAGIT
ncbi:hypothetical protein V6N13_066591 [Hibiscus sabdariffa]